MGDEEKNSPHIYVSKNQPNIGIICVCGERFCAFKIDTHLKGCQIAKDLIAGKNPTVLPIEKGRNKMASVDLKEYEELLDPKFMCTRDGSLLVRYHHKHCWACSGCGHRSETCKTLVNAHINAKVKDSEGKNKDPVEWCCPTPKEWPKLQPNLDTCTEVKSVKVDCIYVKEEVSKKKKTKKTKTTSVTAAKTASVNTTSDSSAAVAAAAAANDDTIAAVADVVVVDTTNSTTATSVVVADNNNENNTDNNDDDDMKVDNEENENNTEERVATAAAVVVAATSTDRRSTRSSVTAVTDTTTTAAAVAITSTSNRNKKRPVTGTIAAVVQTTKGRKMAASIPLFQKVAAKTSTVKGVVRNKRKCNIQKEVQVPITPTRKSLRNKSQQST